MAQDHPHHGWVSPDRAPRLRQIADRLLRRAETAEQPARLRRLARDMRLRAAELEIGPHAVDEVEELADELYPLGLRRTAA